MSFFEFILIFLLILGSSLLSASEVALFSLSRFQFRQIRENFKSDYRRIKKLLADPGGVLISILVANELINITLSTIIATTVERDWANKKIFLIHIFSSSFLDSTPTWLLQIIMSLLITTPIILLLCESTPKVIGVRGNQVVAPLSSGLLNIIYILFKPMRVVLSHLILFISGKAHDREQKKLKEEEFLMLVEKGRKEGTVLESEEDLIRNVFELDDTTVGDVYTPISQVYALSEKTTISTILSSFQKNNFTRIPIFEESKKQILGVLYIKDLIKVKGDSTFLSKTAKEMMHEPYIVRPKMRLNRMFRQMRLNQVHMAIVQGHSKQTLGVITMKDLLDEIFEDLIED